MLRKCCTQYVSKFGKLSSGHETGKCQFSFQSQRKAMPKNVQKTHNCTHLTHEQVQFSLVAQSCPTLCDPMNPMKHASKVLLKILQVRLQQYVNRELPDVQAGFRKGRGTRDQIATRWKKQESSRKTSTSSVLTTPKPLTVWITTNCGIFFKK